VPDPLAVVEALTQLGGVARRTSLLRVVERRDLDAAVRDGVVVRDGWGVYAVPGSDEATRVAALLGGAVSLTSAALRHGWGVAKVPDKPHVTVSRGRRLGARGALAHVHRAELAASEVADGATSEEVTLRDCLRHLPFGEALAVADSALRESGCTQLLARLADEARGPGSARIRRVAAHADGLAANPFESSLRAISLSVPGLALRPQVVIQDGDFSARADLVDRRLRIVAEADSFAWHGSRAALASDCRRYNRMIVAGWWVLRFSYEDVMFHPDEVRDVLVAAVALTEWMNQGRGTAGRSA
jgi:very-short-patch-repair endonuclease